MALLLALVTAAVFWPATRHEFVRYDDDLFVTSNVQVQKGLSLENLKWAFVNPVNCIWHPLTTLSHMADCQFFKLQPWGHHLTSILLHALNTALVFLFLQTMTGTRWRSALVALLFGLHPTHVESVAWVAERKDVLSAGFGLLVLILYVRFVRERQRAETPASSALQSLRCALMSRQYWLVTGFFALGLMSKPMLVTWPFVMLLLDYWPLGRLKTGAMGRLVIEKLPFFALALAAICIAFAVEKSAGALNETAVLPFSARAGNALVAMSRYLGMQFWPVDLAVFYPHPGHWPADKVLFAGVLLISVTVLLVVQRRRLPFSLMGWLWFCGTLVPVIGLVQVGEQAWGDRYTYLPTIGVFIGLVWGGHELARRWRLPAAAWAGISAALVVACALLTRQQLAHWQNTGTLFHHALAVTKNNHIAHFQIGNLLQSEGRLDEAMSHYQEAIRLKPGYADARNNFGTVLGIQGRLDEAILQLRAAAELRPGSAYIRHNLGHALGIQGQLDEAISELQAALRLEPDYPEARNHLGTAFLTKGNLDAAIEQFHAALQLRPNNPEFHNSLGAALFSKGDLDAALTQFQETLRLNPNHAGASNNLARVLEKQNAR